MWAIENVTSKIGSGRVVKYIFPEKINHDL